MEPPTVEIPDLEVINSSNYQIPVRSIDNPPNQGDASAPPNLLVEADSNKFQPDKNSTNPTLATRILEPVNKNVDSIEVARVLNVYDSSAIQLKILLNLDLVFEFLSNDIALNDLATRANILSRMKLILDLKSKFLQSETENTLDRDSQLKLSEQIQSEAKHLCRSFHHNIELENVVIAFLDLSKKSGSTRTKPVNQAKFIKNINNLKVICSERLRTLPSEENNRDKYLVKISKRHQQNITILNKLETQLAEAEELKERELNTLQDELRKLKSDLYQLEQFTEEQIRRTKNEIEKQNQSDSKNSEQRQKKLRLETKDLKLKHSKLLVKNMAEEEQLRFGLVI